ncbi:MAG: hypothetical protein M1352_00075 [Patescibacteria group bacterium]|nr:hypothetical protein [Patescibacteria group bacterium]
MTLKATLTLLFLILTGVLLLFIIFQLWPVIVIKLEPLSLALFSLSIIIYLSVLALFWFLNDKPIFIAAYAFATGLITLFANQNLYGIAVAAILVLFFLIASFKVNSLKNNLTKPSLTAASGTLSSFATMLALGLSVIYYPKALNLSQNFKINIPGNVFQTVISKLEPNLLPNNGSLPDSLKEEALSNFNAQIPQIRLQLINQGITDENQINSQINRAREDYLNQVAANLKTAVSGNNLNPDLLKQTVETQINSLLNNYRQYLPLILCLSVFLTLNFFSSIFAAGASIISQLILYLFILLGLVHREKETLEVERIKLV